MILRDKLLIISYIPYVYKDGGFCITILPNKKSKMESVELSTEEISELLLNSKLRYSNFTPDYNTLLNEYFDELLNIELI